MFKSIYDYLNIKLNSPQYFISQSGEENQTLPDQSGGTTLHDRNSAVWELGGAGELLREAPALPQGQAVVSGQRGASSPPGAGEYRSLL